MMTRHEARMMLMESARLDHDELMPESLRPSPLRYAFQETWRPSTPVPWPQYRVDLFSDLYPRDLKLKMLLLTLSPILIEIVLWLLIYL